MLPVLLVIYFIDFTFIGFSLILRDVHWRIFKNNLLKYVPWLQPYNRKIVIVILQGEILKIIYQITVLYYCFKIKKPPEN